MWTKNVLNLWSHRKIPYQRYDWKTDEKEYNNSKNDSKPKW